MAKHSQALKVFPSWQLLTRGTGTISWSQPTPNKCIFQQVGSLTLINEVQTSKCTRHEPICESYLFPGESQHSWGSFLRHHALDHHSTGHPAPGHLLPLPLGRLLHRALQGGLHAARGRRFPDPLGGHHGRSAGGHALLPSEHVRLKLSKILKRLIFIFY